MGGAADLAQPSWIVNLISVECPGLADEIPLSPSRPGQGLPYQLKRGGELVGQGFTLADNHLLLA